MSKFVVLIRLPPQVLQIEVPGEWTVTKLKVFLVSHAPMLDFDKFQLKANGYLLPGQMKIKEISPGNSPIQIEIVQYQCKGMLDKIYNERIQVLAKQCKNDAFKPVLSQLYAGLINVEQGKEKRRRRGKAANRVVRRQVNANANANDNGNDNPNGNGFQNGLGGGFLQMNNFPLIFKIFMVIALFSIGMMVIRNATATHYLIIGFILFVYFIIDQQVRRAREDARLGAQRRARAARIRQELQQRQREEREQREERGEKQEEKQGQQLREERQDNKINEAQRNDLGQLYYNNTFITAVAVALIRLGACIAQSTAAYFLSLFPNWSVQVHLESNRETFQKVENFITSLEGKDGDGDKNMEKEIDMKKEIDKDQQRLVENNQQGQEIMHIE